MGRSFWGRQSACEDPTCREAWEREARVPASASGSVAATAVAVESETERALQLLKGIYEQKVVPSLKEEFKYGGIFEVK